MNEQIAKIAERIKGLRELNDISVEEMAHVTHTTPEEYLRYEAGELDFSITFLYNVARLVGADMVELLTGELPRLSHFSLIRAGQGLPISRRIGFTYQHMAYLFRDKVAEPLYVTAKYEADKVDAPISLNSHDGQEMDYVLTGKLRVQIGDRVVDMDPGDCLYYDAAQKHGMVAIEGDCTFIAVVIKTEEGKDLL